MKQIIFLILFSVSLYSQEYKTDYFVYHNQINKAETFLFKENNLDSCLYYYDKTFREFDFIFVKDLVNAAQIAKLNKKEYKKYIIQGFENGLKLNHLESFSIFKNEVSSFQKDKKLIIKYNEGRKKYLARIDFEYLDKVYNVALGERVNRYLEKSKYKHKLKYEFSILSNMIKKKGFPGDKLLGIADSTIFRETKSVKLDISIRENKMMAKGRYREYSEINEITFSQSIIRNFFLNLDFCLFNTLDKKTILSEIKKGNIHPKDVAYYSDFAFIYRKTNDLNLCGASQAYPLFNIDLQTEEDFNIQKANDIRKQFYMVDYDTDLKKREFEKQNNLKFFSENKNYR